MPRGRHRYSPPRRLVIPVAIGVSAVATAGAAVLTAELDTWVPGLFVALTAGVALVGAVLIRRDNADAAKRLAAERAARNTYSALADEREAELAELRERVTELDDKLQAKRIDLRRLRSEHADLLRRYALAEQGRANALEGRRQLALESARPTPALPSGPTDHRTSGGAPTSLTYLQAAQALQNLSRNVARQRQQAPGTAVHPQPAEHPPAVRPVTPQPAVPQPAAPQPPAPQPAVPQQQAPARQVGGFDFFGNRGDTGLPAGSPEHTEPDQGPQVSAGPWSS